MALESSKVGNAPAGNPPIKANEVIITFLGEEYLADSVIDLGVHLMDKSKVISHSIPVKPYMNLNEYNFVKDGFETVLFDDTTFGNLKPIYEISQQLTPTTLAPPDELPIIQKSIDVLQNWMTKIYAEKTGISNITVVCSRHMILRVAGCDEKTCHIPGNPLIHLDYIDFEKTYERQCLEQEKHPIPVKCPPLEQLIDVVNIWFPTEEVQDWPLGFLDINSVEIKDYVPIQLVVGSHAASMRYKDGLTVLYKNKMTVPEAYIFRSATQSSEKKGLLHGSFRITDSSYLRKSVELRCLIFKNTEGGKHKTRKHKRKSNSKSRKQRKSQKR
jgi:hypothetical protein